MKKWLKTFHDLALGLFVNGVYAITQGDLSIANFYVIGGSAFIIFVTNKEM